MSNEYAHLRPISVERENTKSIYATPEDWALNKIYQQTSNDRRKGVRDSSGRLVERQGTQLNPRKYDTELGWQKPEGPLLPPRKSRPNGSFYSEKADQGAYRSEVNRIWAPVSRGLETSSQFHRVSAPETGIGNEWAGNSTGQSEVTHTSLDSMTEAIDKYGKRVATSSGEPDYRADKQEILNRIKQEKADNNPYWFLPGAGD
jgi:hypothetical protein